VAVAALVPKSRPNLLAAGVPLPLRDTFDTSAPTPPAQIGETAAPEAAPTEVASLDLSRIPLPHSAPGRTATLTAAAPAPADEISSLVAQLEDVPMARDAVAGAPAQLAYAVPTPRQRPQFDSVLRDVAATAPVPSEAMRVANVEAVKRIVESPAALPNAATPKSAAVTLAAATPSAAPAKPASPLLLAAFETPKPTRAATAIAKLDVPAGKTGRLSRAALAAQPHPAAPAKAAQASIQSRIELASLVSDPASRAAEALARKPNADVLVRDVPTSVFTAGFTSKPLAKSGNQFVGSAVNFLPVAKFD
jgi:hypothetical protein